MEYDQPLIRATLNQRYKRFLADVTLSDGRQVTAHVANPGAMTGLAQKGMTVWLEPNDDPKRKLRYSWRLVEVGTALVGVDTALPNKVAGAALRQGLVPELAAYTLVRPEVKYGKNSRVDFLLGAENLPDCYVEVKSANLSRRAGLVEFPDTVTDRGARHLHELASMAEQGARAVLLYLVQRSDCTQFALAADIDPAYAKAARMAREAGVETLCYRVNLTKTGASLGQPLPIVAP